MSCSPVRWPCMHAVRHSRMRLSRRQGRQEGRQNSLQALCSRVPEHLLRTRREQPGRLRMRPRSRSDHSTLPSRSYRERVSPCPSPPAYLSKCVCDARNPDHPSECVWHGYRMPLTLPPLSPARPPRPAVVLPPLSGPYSPARPTLLPGSAQRPLTSQAPNPHMRPMMSPPARWEEDTNLRSFIAAARQSRVPDHFETCMLEAPALTCQCTPKLLIWRRNQFLRACRHSIHACMSRLLTMWVLEPCRRRAQRPSSGVLKKHCNCKNSRCLKLCVPSHTVAQMTMPRSFLWHA